MWVRSEPEEDGWLNLKSMRETRTNAHCSCSPSRTNSTPIPGQRLSLCAPTYENTRTRYTRTTLFPLEQSPNSCSTPVHQPRTEGKIHNTSNTSENVPSNGPKDARPPAGGAASVKKIEVVSPGVHTRVTICDYCRFHEPQPDDILGRRTQPTPSVQISLPRKL